MKPNNLPVTSREYKLMLNVALFKAREQNSQEFWQLVEFLAISQGAKIIPPKNKDKWYKEELRKTCYIDTHHQELKRNGFILRLREEEKDKKTEFKLTLKYRSSDRYLSSGQNLSVAPLDTLANIDQLSSKFEEDILPPFSSKFSHSLSLESEKKFDLNTIKDLNKFFPSLKELDIPSTQQLKIVNNFVANEVALKLKHKVIFAPEIDDFEIKPALSFWYLLGSKKELPLVAEFSFDYSSKKNKQEEELESFPFPVVKGANQWFAAIQKQVNWLNFNATTKTAYAYEGVAGKNF